MENQEFDMTKMIEKNKRIVERYPILKPNCILENYDYTYTDLDRVCLGWRDIFLEACDSIMSHLNDAGVDIEQFHFFDIKEKWGALNVEVCGYDDDVIENILYNDMYVRSLLICPSCGKPTKCVTEGYTLYLCPDCAVESGLDYNWLIAEDVPVIKEHNYETGEETEKRTKYDQQFLLQWVGEQ